MADNSERTREEDQKAGLSLEQLARTIESKSFFMVNNPELNEVIFDYGNFGDLTKSGADGNGIVHIIQRRSEKDKLSSEDIASLLLIIKEIAETERPDGYDVTGTRAFINKDGIRVILQKNWQGNNKNWLVSGYGIIDSDTKKLSLEAAETIRTVNARYGYKPEHSRLREQVGAVIASIPTIRQKQQEVKDLKSRTKIEKGTKIISTSNPKTVYDRATLKSAPRNSSDKELISAYVAMSYARNALENGNKSELFKHTKAKKLLEKSVNETLIKEIEGELRTRGYTLHINNSINESSMNYERVVVLDVSAGKEKEISGVGFNKTLPPNERQVVEEVKENPIELPENNITQAPESVSNNPAPKTAVLFGKNVYEYEHDGYVARICHGVKEGDYEAKRTMARFLASQIKEPTVLLPCPQHTGEAEYTLEIAEMILEELGPNMVKICNTLVCDPHETMYEQKRTLTEGATRPLSAEQISSLDTGNMRWRENAAQIFGKYIRWKHCLLDNVISTGRTLAEARKLVPDIEPLVFAASKIYLEKNIRKENKLMKKDDMTHGEVVIVRRPHQRPSTVTMFGSFKEALDAYSSDFTLTEYSGIDDYVKNSGFDPENDSEQIEALRKRIRGAGVTEKEPFVEFGIGGYEPEFHLKKDFGEKEALESVVDDDMYSGKVFYAEKGETYGHFAERVYENTRGHNAPDRSKIMSAMSIEPRQLEELDIRKYFVWNLPEGMAPFSDEQIQELVKWAGENSDDELYYDPETDEAFRVWSSDDWELDHDERVLNKSGVADILFHAALRVQDDIDFLSAEQEHGEYLVKIDGERKLKDFYMNKYREVRAHEFADLRQVYCFEEETHGFTSDKMQHQFRFVLNDSNTDALGLKSSNDIYYNLRVQTNIEGHIEDMFLEKRNGDNDLIESDIALDGDDQCIIFDKARNVVEDYIHTSFPELFPYTVDYAFPETKNYNEVRENIGSVPKEITTYEEPRWNFRDEKELLSVIREADEDLYDEIQDAMKENPDDKFYIDLGKSLRYDDTLLWGKDYSKEPLSEKLNDEFDVRYGNEDGSVCNYDDVTTISVKDKKLVEKLNSMVRNHVDENIRAFEKFKDYRDEAVQEWLGTSGTLSHAMIEVPGEEKKFIVGSEVIPTGIKELLDFPNNSYLGSDRQYHDIEYFISRSYKVRDGKPDLMSGETFLTEKVFVDDGAEGVWEIKGENPLERYYFGEDTVRLLENFIDKFSAEKSKQPLVTKPNIERLVRDSIEDNYSLVGKEGGFPEKGTYRLQTGTIPDELVDVLGIKESDRKIVLFGEEHRKEYWLSRAYKIGEDGKIDFSRNPRVRLHAYVDINQNEHTVEDYAVEDLPVPYAEKFDSILNELFDKIASEQSGSPIIEKTPEQEKLELIKDIRNYVTGFENADPDNYSFGEGSFQLQLFCVGKGKDNEYCLEKFLDPDFDTENDAIAFYYNSTDDDAVHDVYWENHVSKSHNSGYISGSNLPEDLKIKFIEECRSTAERFCQNEFDMSVNEVIAANNSGKEIKRNNKHEEKDKNIMEENTSVSLEDFEDCDVCIHKVASSEQTKTWQLHVSPQKNGLPTTTVDLKAVEEPELDDLWVGFMYGGKEFDLNIYKDGDGKRKAAVYAVEDGKTNQEKSVSAADFHVIDYDRLKNIFSKVQTDAADGSTMDFEQLCEYVDTEYADERLYYKARKATGFMIEGFADFEGVTPDDLEKLGFDASHDDIFDISDEAALKVLAGELNSVKEIQATVTEMAKAHRKEIVLDKMISGLDYAYDGEPVGKKIRVYADIDPAKFGFSKTNEDKSSGGEYRLCLVLNEDGTINDRELQFVTKEGDVLYDQQVDVLNGEFYNAFWSDNFGDKAVEWFREQRSMENIFLDIDKHNIREAGEKKGFFTWDELYKLALETGPMDRELKAKDNARWYVANKAEEFGIDIEGAEIPEDAIDDFLAEHPEFDRFNEDGQMIEEEKVIERHYDAEKYDLADKDDLMNLGERYGITEEIANEIYRFYNLTADSEDFELLTDPDAKFVVHEFNSDSTWTVSLPELIFEAKERLLIEKAQEEHPWRDTSVTKLVDEDWYYYMAHKELFSDPSKFTADENGEPSPEDIDIARDKYRESEIERIEAQGKHPGSNKNVSENTAGRTMEDVARRLLDGFEKDEDYKSRLKESVAALESLRAEKGWSVEHIDDWCYEDSNRAFDFIASFDPEKVKEKEKGKNGKNIEISQEDFISFRENILKSCLKENKSTFKTIDFSRNNFNKLFPRSRIETPLESVRFGSGQFSKFSLRERRNLICAVYETLTNPDIVLKEEREDEFGQAAFSHNYAKNFLMDKNSKMVQSVVVEIESENVIITSHERPVNEIVGKIKQADQILYIAPEIGSLIRQHTLNEQSVANQFLGETLQNRTSSLNKSYSYSDEKSIENLLKEGKLTNGDVLRYGEAVGQKTIESINFILRKDNKPELDATALKDSKLEDIMRCIGDAYGFPEDATNKRRHIAFQTLNRAKLVYEKYSEYLTRKAEILKERTKEKEMDNKNTLDENPNRNERYISRRIVGSYTPLDAKDVRKVFVINGFRDSIGGLGDELYEAIKDEMESAWAEEFVSRNSDGMVYWHDMVGEEGAEFAQVDMEKCEKILRNCISTIKDATQGRADQNQFLEPLEQLLKEHEERIREEQMDVIWSEGRMRELFDGMTSSLGSGNQMTFDEMKEWVKEEFPERNDKAVLQDTVSRMLYDNVDFADFEVTEYDDKYRLGDGGDYRWSLAEDAAKKLIYGEIYTIEQVQEAVTARSHEMKKDLLEKSDDRYMMMTTDRIHAAGEIIMSKYEDYPELKSFYEQYYEKMANKTLGMGELVEEKLKEIAEHYNNDEGLVTMESQNDDTETVEITYTPSEIEALIKGRDAYLVGEESLDFIRPNAEQLKKGFEEHISKFDNIARGSWISTGQEVVPDAECIEQIDAMDVFASFPNSDLKAAEQWERDTGRKLLKETKDIFISGLNGCLTFIDTPKNRKILKDYLLDKPLEQKFDWTGFSEKAFNELKKDILDGRLDENYDSSVKDYRGTVRIGNMCIDLTFREQGRTSLDYDFYILGEEGEGERHGVPYSYESGETFDLIGIRDNDYETFKKFFEKEVINTIAKREDLLKDAVQPTIEWTEENAKALYAKKLGDKLSKEFATLDFKPDTWNELLEKGADPREALVIAAEDANLGDNLNWLLDKIGDDKLKEYFSDREFAGRVFDAAKESMTHDLSNSLSDIGDREGFRAFPAFYTSAITRLAELTGKTGELLSYGDDLLIKEGKAVRVEPYTRDEKAMQAVRNALARMEGYGDENEIGTDKVTAFIDNIGNENNHMVIGLGDAAGYMTWYDKAHNGMEHEIPEILAQIESWAENHAAVAEPDSEQAKDYNYIRTLRQYHPDSDEKSWKRIEEQFKGMETFRGNFSEIKKEVLDGYVENNVDYDDKKWQNETVYRLLEENIDFGNLAETNEELDSPDHSEKMEQRSSILEKLSERIVKGDLLVEDVQKEADKLVYGFKFDWTEFSQDNFRKLKDAIENGKIVEGSNYGSVHAGSISIDLAWRDDAEREPLLDIDFYTLGEKGIGGQIELKDGTEVPYSEYFAGQIGFDSVEKYSYEEFKKAYEDVLVNLLAHGEDREHYIREARRPLVDWNNEEQVRVLIDEKMKESKSLSFSDDLDKMRDFDSLTKEEFLDSYSYLTEQQYDATARELSLKGVSGKEQAQEIESGIASKVLQNVREHWNWGGNAVFDEARAWNPEEYGIESEDDHKVHVLVQFHDNHGKGSCPSEKDFSDKVNNHWLIQDLHADGVEVIGLNTEISGTIDQYLSKLKENNIQNELKEKVEKIFEKQDWYEHEPIIDAVKIFRPEDLGAKKVDDDKLRVLVQFHNDEKLKGNKFSEAEIYEALKNTGAELNGKSILFFPIDAEVSGTIDEYIAKAKETNLSCGITLSYIGIDSEKTAELETIISEKPVVGFKLFLEEKSDLRKLFEDTDSGQKLMPGDEVSILANYDTEGLESLSAILVTWNGNGDSVNLLATNLLDDKDKIRIKDVVNNEINLYLERNKEGMSVREAYFTEPKPVKVFHNSKDLADFMNETNRERKDPDIYDEQAEAILYLLTEAQSSVYADEKGNGYLLDLSENFDGMGARASNKDIVELALESADKIKVCDTESKRLIRELYEEFEKNQEKNPIELADEIAAEKEKEIVPELFKKELLSLMRSEKLTVKDPFIATKVILDVWKKEKPQSVQYLNEYLKKSGCTSKEGFEKFFKDEVGLRKKEPAHEFHLKKAAHKRESDGREGR